MSATTPRKLGIYVRISRDKTGAGLSVGGQTSECRDLASRLGWELAAPVFEDNDLSAYSGKPRPAYRRLLAAIETGVVDTVICWHTDRLHRSPVELEEWIAVCEPRGVEVHTVKAGPIDLATPSGRMVARALGAVARYESEHRSERVTAKMDQIVRAGGFLGGVRPFGYTADGMHMEPAEAKLITEGTRTILRGGSLRAVVRAWNESGLTTTKSRKPWEPGAVRDVLVRARNAGLISHRGQVVGPAGWPAIVSEDEWRGVCAVLAGNGRRTSPGNDPKWLGSGLYRCSVCGEGLVVGTSGQQRHPSYKCRSSERGGSRHVTRAAHSLDDFVERILVGRLAMDDARDLFTPPRPEVDTAEIRREIAAIDERRTDLGARFGRGEISMPMLDAANRPMLQRQVALETTLAQAVVSSPLADLLSRDDVAAAWERVQLADRRAVLDALMIVTVHPAPRGRRPDGTYFDPTSIEVEWRRPAT